MTVVFMLLPLAILLAVAFVALFIWATRDGQFDDVRTPQIRMLFDDDQKPEAGPERPGAPGHTKERS